jgi:uroporphyrinogen-III synthase
LLRPEPVRILVTRPEPDCERTAALLRGRGHDVLQQALLRIEPAVDAEIGDGPWSAVLFTSANAVRAIADHRRFGAVAGLPAYTVGKRTHAAAGAVGFARVVSADGDVNALAELVTSDLPFVMPTVLRDGRAANSSSLNLPLLYCAGEDRAGDLAGALQARGVRVETACVYRAAIATGFASDVRAAFAADAIDAVLHYSARTAAAFVAAATAAGIRDLSIRARHLCLSPQVAAPLAAAGATAIDVASEPNEQALFALIASSLRGQ